MERSFSERAAVRVAGRRKQCLPDPQAPAAWNKRPIRKPMARLAVPGFMSDLVSWHHMVLLIWRVRGGQYAK
jgi:hypothetical protein